MLVFIKEKRINEIISNPDFNKADTFKKHLKLLEVKKERLEKLIDLANKTLKGKEKMSFKEFDMTEINKLQEKYRKETEEKLGNTDAYKESMLKTSRYSNSDWLKINKEADLIYRSLVKYMHNPPDRKEVQKLISDWRMHITKYYYYCTVEIFSDLGKAYISDKRFLKNINKYGKGLAEFMSQAIEFYVQNPQSDL